MGSARLGVAVGTKALRSLGALTLALIAMCRLATQVEPQVNPGLHSARRLELVRRGS